MPSQPRALSSCLVSNPHLPSPLLAAASLSTRSCRSAWSRPSSRLSSPGLSVIARGVPDRMDTRVQVMFVISLVLWCGTSFSLDDTAALRAPNLDTVSMKMNENSQLCQLCEEFASEALFYLNENETQTEIMNTLHQACSKFPSFRLECTRLVDYYAPLFFTKIASLSPEEFCVSVSFCGEVTFIRLPRHEDTCTLCHEVVDEIVTNLEDPDMELKIIEILLKGCNNAENFVQMCKRLIIQNAPIIMEHIKKFLEKKDFCNSIHVCGGKAVHVGAQVLRRLSSA